MKAHGYEEELQQMLQDFFEERLLLDKKYVQMDKGKFVELFPKKEYRFYLIIVSILPCIFANIGLTKIIELSVPVLMFLYPLAIILILLTLLSPLFKHSRLVYQITTAFTLLAAIIDGLNALPANLHTITFISVIINFAKDFLPFFSLGMGWILPAVLGFIIGCI